MILIEERNSVKIPGGTSLFVSFNYHPNIVTAIKTCSIYNYNKDTYEWELPLTEFASIIESLS